MAATGRTLFIVLMIAGLAGATAGSAVAAASAATPPSTIRGAMAAASPSSSADSDGSSIVLRGSTPPVAPPAPVYACPPGYTIEPGTGCVAAGYGSEPDYYDWYWPYDFGRRRPFRPHRHAAAGFGHGRGLPAPAFRGMPAHAFGGGHR
jgi:hypothetical protein